MVTRLEEFLDLQQKRLLGVLEDCCCLAGLGDFHQAAVRFAEFRRALESLFSVKKIYAPCAEETTTPTEPRTSLAANEKYRRAMALTEKAWSWLTRSETDAFIDTCGGLSGAVEELFKHELELARLRVGSDSATTHASSLP